MSDGYDPEWAAMAQKMGKPPTPQGVHEIREAFNAGLIQASKLLPPTDPAIRTRDEQITDNVAVRVYIPPGAEGVKLPLIVFCHGGGWKAGNLDTEDHSCRTLCGRAGCIIVSVEYRVWPFVKYEDQCDDCYVAYQWAYKNADTLGADERRYSIWGGSAGASLAIAVVVRLISSGLQHRVSGLIAMAPLIVHPDAVPTRYKSIHTSYDENGGEVPVVTGAQMLEVYEEVVGGETGWRDEKWFPLAGAPDALQRFPTTYIINTDKEACRDDGAVLEAALKDVGVSVKRDVLPALPHYFWCFPLEKAGATFRDTLVEGVKWMIGSEQ